MPIVQTTAGSIVNEWDYSVGWLHAPVGTLEKVAQLHLFLTNYLEDCPNYGIPKEAAWTFSPLGK